MDVKLANSQPSMRLRGSGLGKSLQLTIRLATVFDEAVTSSTTTTMEPLTVWDLDTRRQRLVSMALEILLQGKHRGKTIWTCYQDLSHRQRILGDRYLRTTGQQEPCLIKDGADGGMHSIGGIIKAAGTRNLQLCLELSDGGILGDA